MTSKASRECGLPKGVPVVAGGLMLLAALSEPVRLGLDRLRNRAGRPEE